MAEPPHSVSVTSSPDIFNELEPPPPPQSRKTDGQHSRSHLRRPAQSRKYLQCQPLGRQKSQKKCPKDYTKIRERYEKYFQGNRILPIPELVHEVQPKIISYVVTDLKTKRLAGIKKDTFDWWVLWHINLFRLFNAKSIFM